MEWIEQLGGGLSPRNPSRIIVERQLTNLLVSAELRCTLTMPRLSMALGPPRCMRGGGSRHETAEQHLEVGNEPMESSRYGERRLCRPQLSVPQCPAALAAVPEFSAQRSSRYFGRMAPPSPLICAAPRHQLNGCTGLRLCEGMILVALGLGLLPATCPCANTCLTPRVGPACEALAKHQRAHEPAGHG